MANKNQLKINEIYEKAKQLGFKDCYRQMPSCSIKIMLNAKKAGLCSYKRTTIQQDFDHVLRIYLEKGICKEEVQVPVATYLLLGYSHGTVHKERERRGLVRTKKNDVSDKKTYSPKASANAIQVEINYPEEIGLTQGYSEGIQKKITINAYERDSGARAKCIECHGIKCKGCGFDFERVYGAMGKNYIHVHHIVPLSSIKKEYTVNPINDLCPVCPNCHAMLHSKKSILLTIEELKEILAHQSKITTL